MKRWIQECFDEDSECKEVLERDFLGRILDAGTEGDSVRLCEDGFSVDSYIALSHCWGKSPVLKTTSQTIDRHRQGIPIKSLPNTFQDAVMTTRRLGIRYLWIDSLCILQDDRDDWQREAAKMANIYSNAYLTIAATRAADGEEGLFTPTPNYELSGKTPQGEDFYLIFRKRMVHNYTNTNLDHGWPLFSRAWCFQERLLSPRVIHFGPQELFFECMERSYCECNGITRTEMLPHPKLAFSQALSNSSNGYHMARIWRAVVMQYCDLGLTVPTDIFPALDGAAKRMSKYRPSRYYAGLWEDSLIDDLLWQGHGWNFQRVSPWRAPTWSWASVDKSIYYKDAPLSFAEEEAEDERAPEEFQPHCNFVSCQVVHRNRIKSGFGEIERAHLTLEGDITDGKLWYDVSNPSMERPAWIGDIAVSSSRLVFPFIRTIYYVIGPGNAAAEFIPDYNLSENNAYALLSGTHLACLYVARTQKPQTVPPEDDIAQHFLVLVESTAEPGSYERIGYLEIEDGILSWEGVAKRKTICIV